MAGFQSGVRFIYMAEMKKGQRGIDAARKVMPVGLGLRAVGAKVASRVATKLAGKVAAKGALKQIARRSIGAAEKSGIKVKNYLNYKGTAKIHNGAGNSIGRSGTSYKPFRK